MTVECFVCVVWKGTIETLKELIEPHWKHKLFLLIVWINFIEWDHQTTDTSLLRRVQSYDKSLESVCGSQWNTLEKETLVKDPSPNFNKTRSFSGRLVYWAKNDFQQCFVLFFVDREEQEKAVGFNGSPAVWSVWCERTNWGTWTH